jgi:hypothetical protein
MGIFPIEVTNMANIQGWRNPSPEVIVQELFDLDPDGNPLLPDNGTVEPPPTYNPATQYLAIVKNKWHVIDRPVITYPLEYHKERKLEQLNKYKEWYLNQPVTYDGHKFDADETSKNRLVQAYNVYQITNQLPSAWIDADNQRYDITSVDQIKGIIEAIATTFQTRFFECAIIREQILAATTEEELNAINVPTIPVPGMPF